MKPRFLVVGGGPAGLYAAKILKKRLKDSALIDIIEQRPVLGGLLRTGVAPDHHLIKQTLYNHADLLEHSSHNTIRAFSNITLNHAHIDEISQFYHGVILSSGSDSINQINLQNEQATTPGNIISGHDFVRFYNGDYQDANNALCNIQNIQNAKTVVIIGNGNMSIDICRILTRDWQQYQQNNPAQFHKYVPESFLQWLQQNNFQKIIVVGRRGIVQSAFSLKEMKELAEVSQWNLYVDPSEFRNSLNLQSLEECNIKKDFANRKVISLFIQKLRQLKKPKSTRFKTLIITDKYSRFGSFL